MPAKSRLDILCPYDRLKYEHVMRQEDIMKDNAKMVGGFFLIGGVIGSVIALLYAPKSGRETREDITKAARRMKDNAVDLIEETMEDVNDFAADLREKTADVIDQGMDLSEKARREIVSTIDHGQRAIWKKRKKLKKALGI